MTYMAADWPPFFISPLGCGRREIRPAVIQAIRRRSRVCGWNFEEINADFDGVNEAVPDGRRERQAVFMTDELGDLRVGFVECFRAGWKIGAASCGFGHLFQELVGLLELLRSLRGIRCGTFLFVGGPCGL